MKRLSILFALLLFAGVLIAQTGEQEYTVIEATGMGSIVAGDLAHARDDAIDDALRTGIEQALGMLVESETLTENYQLIEDRIISKTQGYVQNYRVLREGKQDDMLYEVTVEARVKVADIKNDLEGIQTLMRRKNTPRMMVLIEERNVGETPGLYAVDADLNTAETAMMDAFMAKGFRFVDQSTVKRNLSQQKKAALLAGDAEQAAAIAKMVGAEVLLSGKALAKATEITAYGTKIRSQQATVSVRAIRTDTGDIIATSTGQGKFSHIDDIAGGTAAIQKAAEKVSAEIMDEILERWQSDVSSGSTITLQVQGVSDFALLSKFKTSLPYYVRGMESVTQRSWSNGFATFEVVMKGNADDLASRLSNKDMEGHLIRVVGMTQNSVSVLIEGSSASQ